MSRQKRKTKQNPQWFILQPSSKRLIGTKCMCRSISEFGVNRGHNIVVESRKHGSYFVGMKNAPLDWEIKFIWLFYSLQTHLSCKNYIFYVQVHMSVEARDTLRCYSSHAIIFISGQGFPLAWSLPSRQSDGKWAPRPRLCPPTQDWDYKCMPPSACVVSTEPP